MLDQVVSEAVRFRLQAQWLSIDRLVLSLTIKIIVMIGWQLDGLAVVVVFEHIDSLDEVLVEQRGFALFNQGRRQQARLAEVLLLIDELLVQYLLAQVLRLAVQGEDESVRERTGLCGVGNLDELDTLQLAETGRLPERLDGQISLLTVAFPVYLGHRLGVSWRQTQVALVFLRCRRCSLREWRHQATVHVEIVDIRSGLAKRAAQHQRIFRFVVSVARVNHAAQVRAPPQSRRLARRINVLFRRDDDPHGGLGQVARQCDSVFAAPDPLEAVHALPHVCGHCIENLLALLVPLSGRTANDVRVLFGLRRRPNQRTFFRRELRTVEAERRETSFLFAAVHGQVPLELRLLLLILLLLQKELLRLTWRCFYLIIRAFGGVPRVKHVGRRREARHHDLGLQVEELQARLQVELEWLLALLGMTVAVSRVDRFLVHLCAARCYPARFVQACLTGFDLQFVFLARDGFLEGLWIRLLTCSPCCHRRPVDSTHIFPLQCADL